MMPHQAVVAIKGVLSLRHVLVAAYLQSERIPSTHSMRTPENQTKMFRWQRNPMLVLVAFVALFYLPSAMALASSANVEDSLLGLPPRVESDQQHSAEKRELGKQLFSDPILSIDATVSCESCHLPSLKFTDGRSVGKGVGGKQSFRNTPSLLNVSFLSSLFWDGRATSLESQLVRPLINQDEHGLKDVGSIVRVIREQARYLKSFNQLYGVDDHSLSIREISDAISIYERSLLSGNSPFDRYYFAGQNSALTADAIRGLALFEGRAGCSSCHLIEKQSALFTDQAFHQSPKALTESVTTHLPELVQQVLIAKQRGDAAIDALISNNRDIAELGHFVVTLNPADIGTFRTPSLRNVALTAPYLHDGSSLHLEDVIDAELYIRGNAGSYPITLTIEERADLLAFLKSLSSKE